MIEYDENKIGKKIGCGYFRKVFEYDNDGLYCIKFDKNGRGKNCNLNEFNNQSVAPELFPIVYCHAEDFEWIICERLNTKFYVGLSRKLKFRKILKQFGFQLGSMDYLKKSSYGLDKDGYLKLLDSGEVNFRYLKKYK